MRRIPFLLVVVALSACSQARPAASPTLHPLIPTSSPATTPAALPQIGAPAQPAPPAGDVAAFPNAGTYKWAAVASGLLEPTDIQFPDDGSSRMFVLEQPGTIRLVRNGQVSSTPFLDITAKVGSGGSEQGLLGLAFHPGFANNPYFYVNYTDTAGNTVIARYKANGDSADPASERILLHVAQPFANHNGGALAFGPDGFLYAGLGDGGGAGDSLGNGQNKNALLGKLLRIDVDHGDPYSLPPGNPFGNEVWEYGLRNPWRISFDRANSDLFIADVGQDTWEEVDYVPNGQGGLNFGWNYREGLHAYSGTPPAGLALAEPVAEYRHISNRCSITGGYVYRGSMPEWQGIYFYADFCSGELWGMLRSTASGSINGWLSQVLWNTGNNITTFGQDTSGELYYADRKGVIYQLQK